MAVCRNSGLIAALAVASGLAIPALAWGADEPAVTMPPVPAMAPAPMPASATPVSVTPASATPASATPVAKPAISTADELLDALAVADRDLRTFSASMQYIKVFPAAQGGDIHIRRGTLNFQNQDPGLQIGRPRRAFAVRFSELIIGATRRDELRSFIFDGTWLVERDEGGKQFFKRRIVTETSNADPLRIGEGPFPLPIGQRRADIVGAFEVSLADPLENVPTGERFDKLREMLTKAYQLKLSPKPGTRQARDYREVRLWYRQGDYLPVFAQSVNTDESRHEIFLINVEKNPKLPATAFVTDAPDPAVDVGGWTVEISEPPARPASPQVAPPPLVPSGKQPAKPIDPNGPTQPYPNQSSPNQPDPNQPDGGN